MGLDIYGTVKTGYNLKNLEKLYEMKDYSIVGSSLMGTELGIELHVDVKVGQHNGKPLIASYCIFESIDGTYCYQIDEEDFSTIGKPERSFNCHSIEDISTFNGWNNGYVYKNIGGNGYRCIATPEIIEYDREKVKERAFWCLENHYIPELKEVFSLIKPVDEMKVTPDMYHREDNEDVMDTLKITGVYEQILAASGNYDRFVKKDIYQKNSNNQKQFKDEVYFGYIYEGSIHEGKHYPMVVLEGSDAVAKFVCNPKTIGNDKIVTDVLDRMMFSTYGIYINQKGRYANPDEVDKLIEKVIEEQSKMFENNEEFEEPSEQSEEENEEIDEKGDERV